MNNAQNTEARGRKKGSKVIKRKLSLEQLLTVFPKSYKITVPAHIYSTVMEQFSEEQEQEMDLEPTVDEELSNSDEDMIEVPDVPEQKESQPAPKAKGKKAKVKA